MYNIMYVPLIPNGITTYLCNGLGILDHLNEACLWSSGHAAVRDELKIKSLLFPQLGINESMKIRVSYADSSNKLRTTCSCF